MPVDVERFMQSIVGQPAQTGAPTAPATSAAPIPAPSAQPTPAFPAFGPAAPLTTFGIQQNRTPGLLEMALQSFDTVFGAGSRTLWGTPGQMTQALGMSQRGGSEGFFDFVQDNLNDPTWRGDTSRAFARQAGSVGLILNALGPGSPSNLAASSGSCSKPPPILSTSSVWGSPEQCLLPAPCVGQESRTTSHRRGHSAGCRD